MLNSACANTIFNLVAYYTAWFGGIYFASQNNNTLATLTMAVIILLQVAWQFYRRDTRYLLPFVVCLTIFGCIVDTRLIHYHIIQFNANPFHTLTPPWMMALWVSFAIVTFSALKKYFRYSIALGVLSLIFFPLSYYAGSRMGAAVLPQGPDKLWIMGVIWAFLYPVYLLFFANRLNHHD